MNLSAHAEPVKFKGANSMYNKKPPLAMPGQIPQNMQSAIKHSAGNGIGASQTQPINFRQGNSPPSNSFGNSSTSVSGGNQYNR